MTEPIRKTAIPPKVVPRIAASAGALRTPGPLSGGGPSVLSRTAPGGPAAPVLVSEPGGEARPSRSGLGWLVVVLAVAMGIAVWWSRQQPVAAPPSSATGSSFDFREAMAPLADAQEAVSSELAEQRAELEQIRTVVADWESTRTAVLDLQATLQGISSSISNPVGDDSSREWMETLTEELGRIRGDLDARLIPLVESQSGFQARLDAKQQEWAALQQRVEEVARVRESVEQLGAAFSAYTSAPPQVVTTTDPALTAAIDDVRTQVVRLTEGVSLQGDAIAGLQRGVDDVARVRRLLSDLERGLPALLEKQQRHLTEAVRSDVAGTIGELQAVVSSMQAELAQHQDAFATLEAKVNSGALVTTIQYRVSMMDLPPGTPVGRTRLIPYEGMFVVMTNVPAPKPSDPFETGKLVLAPSAFAERHPVAVTEESVVASPGPSEPDRSGPKVFSPADFRISP
jgi:hypothetical protein